MSTVIGPRRAPSALEQFLYNRERDTLWDTDHDPLFPAIRAIHANILKLDQKMGNGPGHPHIDHSAMGLSLLKRRVRDFGWLPADVQEMVLGLIPEWDPDEWDGLLSAARALVWMP